MEDKLIQYGALGMFLVFLMGILKILWEYFKQNQVDHRRERDEWRGTIINQFEEAKKRDQEQRDLLNEIRRLLNHRDKNE